MNNNKKPLILLLVFGIIANLFFIPALILTIKNANNHIGNKIFILYFISFIFFTITLYFGFKYIIFPKILKYYEKKHNTK